MVNTLHGYNRAFAAERGGFGMLISFASTIALARAINYVRERRRPAPRIRSWGRRVYHAAGRGDARIHHFLPGIALMLLSGGGAILARNDGREFWFSLPFGTGAGLTFDEIAVLAELDNPYWGTERLAAVQAGTAALGAVALGVRFRYLERDPAAKPRRFFS
jgi:hypothetical protein